MSARVTNASVDRVARVLYEHEFPSLLWEFALEPEKYRDLARRALTAALTR